MGENKRWKKTNKKKKKVKQVRQKGKFLKLKYGRSFKNKS